VERVYTTGDTYKLSPTDRPLDHLMYALGIK